VLVNPTRRLGKHVAPTAADKVAEIEVFDRGELARLLSLAEQAVPEYHPFLLCLARTGMRLGEAIGLEWRDVHWTARVIHVRRSRRRNRVSHPKNGKARRVDMSRQLAETLQSLKTLQEAEAVVAGQAPPEPVFSDRTGGPIQDDGFRNNVWAPLLRRAQLRYRKPHTLRHSYASMLIEAGEPSPTFSSSSANTPPPSLRRPTDTYSRAERDAPWMRSTTRPSATHTQPRFPPACRSPVFPPTSAPPSSTSDIDGAPRAP
jgi:integrase